MKTIFAGQANTFTVNLDAFADAGSAIWSLRDNTGTPMSGYTDQAIANVQGANVLLIPVPAAANTKGAALGLTESRYLQVQWTNLGLPLTKLIPYLLADFMPMLVSPDEVRAACGLSVAELPDADIDLPTAAMLVRLDVTPTVFDAALIAGDYTTPLVNLMIAYKVILNLGTSLPVRIAVLMAEGDTKFQRLATINVSEMIEGLVDAYYRVKTTLTGNLPVPPTLFTRAYRPGLAIGIYPGLLGVPIIPTPPGQLVYDAYFPWWPGWSSYQT